MPAGVVSWWATSILVWTAYGLGGFAGQLPDDDAYPYVETSARLLVEGMLTFTAATALVASAALIIRIMFGINATQDALASTLRKPLPRPNAYRLRQRSARPRRGSATTVSL